MAKEKTNKIIVFALVLALTGFVIATIYAPRPIDWTPSYSQKHTSPLGEKLVYKVLPTLFENQRIVSMHSSLTSFLEKEVPYCTNFIFITDRFFPDESDTKKLLEVVEAGNMVFLAAERLSPELMSQLDIELKNNSFRDPTHTNNFIQFNFTNRRLKTATGYSYKKAISNNFITSYDTLRTTVLGHNHIGKTNFIRIKFGEGYLFFNSNPMAFTNYHLLKEDNSEYIFKCLSYLPSTSTVWDEFNKPGSGEVVSELGYILNNPALRVAWYLLLLGVVIFFLFKGKRRQRAIPVVTPPANSTLEFVKTVGRLYFVKKDHKDIAQKRFVYFLDFLRTRYFVDTSHRGDEFMEEVSKKSGIQQPTVGALFKVAGNVEKAWHISQDELQQFNRHLEYFYTHCNEL